MAIVAEINKDMDLLVIQSAMEINGNKNLQQARVLLESGIEKNPEILIEYFNVLKHYSGNSKIEIIKDIFRVNYTLSENILQIIKDNLSNPSEIIKELEKVQIREPWITIRKVDSTDR